MTPHDRLLRLDAVQGCAAATAECSRLCALSACAVSGGAAVIVQMRCASPDACRLRTLGVYEGARVTIVDGRNGLLLDVRGSRLAIDRRTAESILVQPQEAA